LQHQICQEVLSKVQKYLILLEKLLILCLKIKTVISAEKGENCFANNVDEIETTAQFYQHFMSTFCTNHQKIRMPKRN